MKQGVELSGQTGQATDFPWGVSPCVREAPFRAFGRMPEEASALGASSGIRSLSSL